MECIYCGARDIPLTDEHTIPEGMGGRHILPKASCKSCQKIINEEFEQYCQRTLFGNLRASFKLRSRKKRKPLRHSIQVRTHEGAIKRIYKDAADLPPAFVLPAFPNPYFLTDQEIGDTFEGAWWQFNAKPMPVILAELGVESIITEQIFPVRLARFIAKIAHAHAWAVYGPIFEPCLPPVILGENKRYIEFVGGILKDVEPAKHDELKIFRASVPGSDESYLTARIRFFARLGAPVYYAVIGRLLVPWPPEERQA